MSHTDLFRANLLAKPGFQDANTFEVIPLHDVVNVFLSLSLSHRDH